MHIQRAATRTSLFITAATRAPPIEYLTWYFPSYNTRMLMHTRDFETDVKDVLRRFLLYTDNKQFASFNYSHVVAEGDYYLLFIYYFKFMFTIPQLYVEQEYNTMYCTVAFPQVINRTVASKELHGFILGIDFLTENKCQWDFGTSHIHSTRAFLGCSYYLFTYVDGLRTVDSCSLIHHLEISAYLVNTLT